MANELADAIANIREAWTVDFMKGSITQNVGSMYSHLYYGSLPSAISAPSPGIDGELISSYSYSGGLSLWPGALKLPRINGGERLARVQVQATLAGVFYILHRLWHNSGISVTTTGAQAISSGTFGDEFEGAYAALECSSTTGNGAAISNTTISYTDINNGSGRTGTFGGSGSANGSIWTPNAQAGCTVPFLLQAGDTQIQSIESISLGTSYVSGAVHLVMYRPVAILPILRPYRTYMLDLITSGFYKPSNYHLHTAFLSWSSGNVFYTGHIQTTGIGGV